MTTSTNILGLAEAPADFLAGVSQDQLNQISIAIFPGIKDKLTGTSSSTDPDVTATWAVATPPVFDLCNDGSQDFALKLDLTISLQAGTAKPTSETVQATGACSVAINGDGVLNVHLNDVAFATTDPFLMAVLEARKAAIISTLDTLLRTVNVPVGPIENLTFHGYATQIRNRALYVGGGLSGAPTIETELPIGPGFAVQLSNTLMQAVVAQSWWANTPKSFRPNSDVTVDLRGYAFNVSNGRMSLTLGLGGDIYLDELVGTAHWSINISPVHVDVTVAIDDHRKVNIVGGGVSTPSVSTTPENALAVISSCLSMGVLNDVINIIISQKIPGSIQSHLNGTVFTVPVISESFQGVSFSLTPKDLVLQVTGDTVVIQGAVGASVG